MDQPTPALVDVHPACGISSDLPAAGLKADSTLRCGLPVDRRAHRTAPVDDDLYTDRGFQTLAGPSGSHARGGFGGPDPMVEAEPRPLWGYAGARSRLKRTQPGIPG